MTRADARGRGYASSLINMLTAEVRCTELESQMYTEASSVGQADRQGRASWLLSSNPKDNRALYNSLGFWTVAEYLLGEDDTEWKEKPVKMDIVSRPTRMTEAVND